MPNTSPSRQIVALNPLDIPPPAAPSATQHSNRTFAGLLLLASLGILLVAALLHADHTGLGTHQQLGLPRCGFLVATGLPCATCGMTTAFALASQGRIAQAFHTQPAGALLAVTTASATLLSAWALLTNASLALVARLLWRPATLVSFIAIVLGSWAYKILLVREVFQ